LLDSCVDSIDGGVGGIVDSGWIVDVHDLILGEIGTLCDDKWFDISLCCIVDIIIFIW
jgi:hypothetical protein